MASNGGAWRAATATHNCAEVAATIGRAVLDRGIEAFGEHVRRVKAQNDDLAEAQLRSLDAHLTNQRVKYERLRARFLERGNLGLARVQEGHIDRLVARVERENSESLSGGNCGRLSTTSASGLCTWSSRISMP